MTASTEYELKARLPVDPDGFRRILTGAGWVRVFAGSMSDWRLDSDVKALEGREEVLRLRRYEAPDGRTRTVLAWKGPARVKNGFKVMDEVEVDVADGTALREILARLGFGDITLMIDRRIERYEKGSTSVRIEEYPRMDVLVEVEGEPGEVDRVLGELSLPRGAWVDWQLPRFVAEYERRTGERAKLVWDRENE